MFRLRELSVWEGMARTAVRPPASLMRRKGVPLQGAVLLRLAPLAFEMVRLPDPPPALTLMVPL